MQECELEFPFTRKGRGTAAATAIWTDLFQKKKTDRKKEKSSVKNLFFSPSFPFCVVHTFSTGTASYSHFY